MSLTLNDNEAKFYRAAVLEGRMKKCRKLVRPIAEKIMSDGREHTRAEIASAVADAAQKKKLFTAGERDDFEKDLLKTTGIYLNVTTDPRYHEHRLYLAAEKGGAYQVIEHAGQKAHDREATRLAKKLLLSDGAVESFAKRYAGWHGGQTPPAFRAMRDGLEMPDYDPDTDEDATVEQEPKKPRSRKRPAAEATLNA